MAEYDKERGVFQMMLRTTTCSVVSAAAVMLLAAGAMAQLGPVPVPPANQITEAKRVLGKALFWDEQLSSDNTMACGTCHTTRGGSDLRNARMAGVDGVLNTADDVFGSPGMNLADSANNFKPDAVFGFGKQITSRNSMSFLMAAYAPQTFWDGRGTSRFVDPVTGQQVIANGGGLESQAAGPPTNDTEMAHEQRNWGEITVKLADSRPLAAANAIPADVAAVLTNTTKYPALFAAAFGTPTITASRVAMAIATYERTTIPNDTPWDRFIAGQQNALTQGQIAGLQTFNANCAVCHVTTNGQFTGNGFRNVGLRPPAEDLGFQLTTGNANDRGKFKVPSLRNVGLRTRLMHNGQFVSVANTTAIQAAVRFYVRAPGAAPQFPDNRDPAMNAINFPPQAEPGLVDFLTNGLTDARVANQTFPFDQPSLASQRASARPTILPGGTPGTGGVVPQVLAVDPSFVGNDDFRIGVTGGLGGATARVLVSMDPPVNGRLMTGTESEFMTLGGTGSGNGFGTLRSPIGANGVLNGRVMFYQWIITDASAAGGESRSNIARAAFFCGGIGCPPSCRGDFNLDGTVDPDDLSDFIGAFFTIPQVALADFNGDGAVDPDDLADFIGAFFGGCSN